MTGNEENRKAGMKEGRDLAVPFLLPARLTVRR
jgi:hypothetical protein